MLRRLISSVLAFAVMAAGFAAFQVSAASEADVPDTNRTGLAFGEVELIEYPDGVRYIPDGSTFHVSGYQPANPLSLFNENTRNFYDILTADEKRAYDMMVNALEADHTVEIVDMPGIDQLYTPARAYCALIADHPEYFWLYGLGFGYIKEDDGTISDIDVRFNYCAGQSAKNIESNYTKLMKTVAEVVGEAEQYDSDYDKIKYFATYISDKVTYNDNAAAVGLPSNAAYANCWNAYGGLITGDGVCEAYAEAFKLLCDKAGIPCVSMYSTDHEWNAVKLDGKWYYVDVTWIDTENKDTYRYDQWLAVGTVSAKKNDNSIGSHTQNPNTILVNYESKFTYPKISALDYGAVVSGEFILGDVDGSGEEPNNDDLIILAQYLANWDVDINYEAANVDGDPNGNVNNDDLIRLAQILAGWTF